MKSSPEKLEEGRDSEEEVKNQCSTQRCKATKGGGTAGKTVARKEETYKKLISSAGVQLRNESSFKVAEKKGERSYNNKMVNPHRQSRRSQSRSMKTNNKQKKQNTQNIPICKPEQTIRIMTWHAFHIFERKKMATEIVKGIILETDSANKVFY